VIAKTICAPLERVKIVLQTQSSQEASAKKYKGILDAMTGIPRDQGFSSFWRGNLANCLRYFPTQAMNFAFKDKYQKMFVKPREQVGFWLWFAGYLAAGGAAGATALTVSYPLEYSFTRLAADHGSGASRKYQGIVDCVTKTVKADGIRGIYRGYGPSVAGIIIYRAGYFGLYDFSKEHVLPHLGIGKDDHSLWTIFLRLNVAITIDIFSAMCAYPLDTIRRSMMMMSDRPVKLYTNSFACARYLHKDGGLPLFYKGALMNSIRAIGSALVLVLYDELKFHLITKDAKSSH
jgi:solute carrier family 25 (adenine nucleotide translocator) protein 4/5/6/31